MKREKQEGVCQAGKEGKTVDEMMRCWVVPFHLFAEEQFLVWGDCDGCHRSVTTSGNAKSLLVASELTDAPLVTATAL